MLERPSHIEPSYIRPDPNELFCRVLVLVYRLVSLILCNLGLRPSVPSLHALSLLGGRGRASMRPRFTWGTISWLYCRRISFKEHFDWKSYEVLKSTNNEALRVSLILSSRRMTRIIFWRNMENEYYISRLNNQIEMYNKKKRLMCAMQHTPYG